VWVVRKVGVPWHEELGIGAVAEDGYRYINQETAALSGLSQGSIHELVKTKEREVEERVGRFRSGRERPDLRGRTVIVVDDGIATGGTVRAAIASIRAQAPKTIILAVPVASRQTLQTLAAQVDRVVCLLMPTDLYAIGLWYVDFGQVSDDDVVRLLERARVELELEESPRATV
jgi:putative phosphoribosyl transferase